MKFWVNQNNNYIIELFSFCHLLLIGITIIIVVLLYFNKKKISNISDRRKRIIRIIIGTILLLNIILRRGSFWYYNVYDWRNHLDINFCNFTSILFIIYSFSGNKSIYNICYYMTFIGPLLSILFPSTNLKLFNYSFISYLIIHHLIFLYNYFLMYAERKKYNKKDLLNATLFIIMYFIIVYVFNIIFGTNYNLPTTFLNPYFIDMLNKLNINNYLLFLGFGVIVIMFLKIGKYNLRFFQEEGESKNA